MKIEHSTLLHSSFAPYGENTLLLIMSTKAIGLQTVSMPLAGLGTWSGVMTPQAAAEVEGAIEAALEVGVRLIDCATAYQNEPFIGKVLKKWIDSGTYL